MIRSVIAKIDCGDKHCASCAHYTWEQSPKRTACTLFSTYLVMDPNRGPTDGPCFLRCDACKQAELKNCSDITPDIEDLEAAGWSCYVCPRKTTVKSSKLECDFTDCLSEFEKRTQPLYIQQEDARHQAHYDAALGEVWNPPTLEQLRERHKDIEKKLLVGKTVTPVSGALWLASEPTVKLSKNTQKACVFTGKGKVLQVEQHILDYDAYDKENKDNPDHTPYQMGKLLYTSLLIKCDAGQGWAGEGAIKYE